MDLGLKDRVAAVAAASSGLGRATARALAAEGARVAICGRHRDTIVDAARSIADETGNDVEPFVVDVSSGDDCRRFVSATVARFSRLDILVTNSGGPRPGTFGQVGDEEWDAGFRVTLASIVHLVRAAAPEMARRGWGRIVNVASLSARQPVDGLVLSNTFRPAVVGLAKTLSLELAGDGILVNTGCPGYTRTPRLEELASVRAKATGTTPGAWLEELAASIPLGRIAEVEEFAAVVAFLCSERASYVTGTTLPIDGGAIRGLA